MATVFVAEDARYGRKVAIKVLNPDLVAITCDVADALSNAHSLGIIRRDIKPENVLIHGGHAVVADFGIARVAPEARCQRHQADRNRHVARHGDLHEPGAGPRRKSRLPQRHLLPGLHALRAPCWRAAVHWTKRDGHPWRGIPWKCRGRFASCANRCRPKSRKPFSTRSRSHPSIDSRRWTTSSARCSVRAER
jgi:serine/threonine protein kinase